MGLYAITNNILFFGMATHIFMTNYYPIQYNVFLVEVMHFCVLAYSKLQIFLDRQYRNLKKNPDLKGYTDYFEELCNSFTINSGNIEVIKDSQVFVNTSVEKLDKNNHPPELMDFLIYSEKEESGRVNKVLYYDIPDNFAYEKCKFKFVALTVSFSEKEQYNLKLCTDKENYYIVDNRLNKYLFCYLIMKQFGIIKNESSVTYSVDIYDQNINNIILCEKDEIVLGIDKYIIRKIQSENGSGSELKCDEYIKVGDELLQ